jgi:hypothetical protein
MSLESIFASTYVSRLVSILVGVTSVMGVVTPRTEV